MAALGRRIALALTALLLVVSLMPTHVSAQTPDVEYEVLAQATTDPLMIEVADDGRVIWTQRDGSLWVLTPEGAQIRAGQLAVSANHCPTCIQQDEGHTLYHSLPNPGVVAGLEEGGLHGLLLAEDFAESGRVFLFYSVPGSRNPGPETLMTDDGAPIPPTFGLFRLSTFVLNDLNVLDPLSEDVVLEVPVEWDHCCHYGGNLDRLPDGTIILTTGDDAHFRASNGYGARELDVIWHNAEMSSANPGDRRGKVLRLMPDGSVPDGSQEGIAPNPFVGHEGYNPYIPDESGTPGDGWIAFDPYVYALGFKQPWRASVHPNGTIYVDDVGPDATADDPQRGPAGMEEVNVIPPGGGTHHGWPRCMGDNLPYIDVNWSTGEVGGPLDCSSTAPISRPLPGAPEPQERFGMTGAAFAYGRGASDEYPVMGSGGLTAQPVAVYPTDPEGPLALPERFHGRLIVPEYSRNYILTIPLAEDGSMVLDNDQMERLDPRTGLNTDVPSTPQGVAGTYFQGLAKPIDGVVGPDGAFYFLEYGHTIYSNPYSRVSRIKCAGCAPEDPTRNYGLPLPGEELAADAPQLGAVGVVPPAGRSGVVLLIALASLVLWRRRRSAVV